MSSNVPQSSTYQVFYSQLVRISRIVTHDTEWRLRIRELVDACLSVGADTCRLANKFGQFCQSHQNLLWKYGTYTDADRKALVVEVMLLQ